MLMDRLGKKGIVEQIQFETIMELILAAIVAVALFVYVANVSSNALFEQNFMARDLGLLIDAIYAAPGNISCIYDTTIAENKIVFVKFFPETKFSFLFKDSVVNVFTTESNLEKPAEYYFGTDSQIKFDPTDRLKYNLILGKSKDELKISSAEQVTKDVPDE